MPKTSDKSIFPGIGLTCHFSAGATSEKPEFPGPLRFAKYVGRSTSSSKQGAIPNAIGCLNHQPFDRRRAR